MHRNLASFFGAIILSSLLGLASTPLDSKQVAVSGNSYACEEFEKLVVQPAGFDAVRFVGTPIPVVDFPKFRAVVFAERDEIAMREGSKWSPEDFEKVENYVQSGGTIVFCRYGISTVLADRSLGNWKNLTGFSSYPDATDPGRVELTPAFLKWLGGTANKEPLPKDLAWATGATPIAEGLASAEELAALSVNSGTAAKPFITLNQIGKGRVYFLGTSLNALTRQQADPDSLAGLAVVLRASLGESR